MSAVKDSELQALLEQELREQLARLQQEHRDLDGAIGALQDSPGADIVQVQRLKRRKLFLRDRMSLIEDQLKSDLRSGLSSGRAHGVKIGHAVPPNPGEPFRFYILGSKQEVTIKAYIGSALIFTSECPDPPCHEIVQIPQDTAGATLRVVATDHAGLNFEQKFTIGTSNEPNKGGSTVVH
jgi:hypothetical protein